MTLDEVLAAVLHDVAASGLTAPRLQVSRDEDDWVDLEHWSGTSGRRFDLAAPPAEILADVMDWVQEHAVMELGPHGNNWPACPQHPDRHPLDPRFRDDQAWWCCPVDGAAVRQVGALGALP